VQQRCRERRVIHESARSWPQKQAHCGGETMKSKACAEAVINAMKAEKEGKT
jgi:hypothetical protein